MVLQKLTQLYEVLAESGEVTKIGWNEAKVSYGVVIDNDGNVTNIISLKVPDSKGKKFIAVSKSVPEHPRRTVGIMPCFICDTSTYIFGIDSKGKPERAKQCFEACKEYHKDILTGDSAEEKAIINFFEKHEPQNTEQILINAGCMKDDIKDIFDKGANLIIMPNGKFATDYEIIVASWENYYNSRTSETKSLCMITGKVLPIARIHPVIKGVYNAQAMGTSLVSFNAEAFESYNKKQGDNSPISEYSAFAYSTALNYLLSNSDYVNHFGDTTVVYWTDDNNKSSKDIMASFFGGDEDKVKQSDLQSVIRKLASGQSVNWNDVVVNPQNKFYILGLSPNAGRLSVRFFLENTFGGFMKNIALHQDNMKIIEPSFIKYINIPIWKMLSETVNQKSKDKSPKPQLAGSLLYSVFTGTNYPATLYNGVMIRVRAEHNITYEKASIIKAYLLRNYNEKYKEVLTVKLNKDCTNQAYVLGQLFALLEDIQQTANPNINTTIRDRYFTSASSTPARVFPTLIDLAQKHLKKVKNNKMGLYVTFEKKFTSLMGKITDSMPTHLTMEDKGVFQIGYYHYVQDKYSKEDK